jgi:predicted dinucleotide-binding enzyme
VQIGIVGAGMIGGALARLSTAVGHDVVVANSRGPETLAGLVSELGPRAHAGTVGEAAAHGDLVIVTIPLRAVAQLDATQFAGRVVVDTNNYYTERDGALELIDSGARRSSQLVQEWLAGARVVKAFNTLYFQELLDRAAPDAPDAERVAVPIAADDVEAEATVAGFVRSLGFTPVSTGSLAASDQIEPGSEPYGKVLTPAQLRDLLDL